MGGRGYGGGERGRVYTYRYTVNTRMTCIKMGSDESHLNVSKKKKKKRGEGGLKISLCYFTSVHSIRHIY